ncbi:MAG: DUF975 family protein [Ruminococcaceae bacterium]|nr:DUF975 family protein [Oscillospiraceae bacterium]
MEASAHRARARDALRGNWVTAVLVCLLASLIAGAGISPEININFESSEIVQFNVPEQLEQFLAILGIALPVILIFSTVMMVVGLILGGVMELGKARYFLNLIDHREGQVGDLFSGFPQFVQALVMNLLRDLMIAAGMLLLIVPGLILTYSFAMAPYILSEDPECSGWEALQRSRAMMRGHKGELFWLELTFLGWTLLAAFTFGIGTLFLNPYMEAAHASFFRGLQDQGYAAVEDF